MSGELERKEVRMEKEREGMSGSMQGEVITSEGAKKALLVASYTCPTLPSLSPSFSLSYSLSFLLASPLLFSVFRSPVHLMSEAT